jgi:chromosome segregation ATPase
MRIEQLFKDNPQAARFRFSPPGLDPAEQRQLIGRMIRHIRVKDLDKYGVAIETIGGSWLFSIITEEQTLAAKLVKKRLTGSWKVLPLS